MKLVSGEPHKLTRKPWRFESSSRNNIEVYHRYIRKINFGDWCNWITREFLALKLLGSSPLSPTILSYGVMATQKILDLLFWVRILVAQQKIKKYHKDFLKNQIRGIIDL